MSNHLNKVKRQVGDLIILDKIPLHGKNISLNIPDSGMISIKLSASLFPLPAPSSFEIHYLPSRSKIFIIYSLNLSFFNE
jgi:hypothetical protein